MKNILKKKEFPTTAAQVNKQALQKEVKPAGLVDVDAIYAQINDMQTLQKQLTRQNVHVRKNLGQLIHHAILNNNSQLLELLQKLTVDVDSRNEYGWTALQVAVVTQNMNLLQQLKQPTADAVNDFGLTALNAAIYRSNTTMVKFLVGDLKANVNRSASQRSMTPLMVACHVGKSVGLVNYLLVKGAEVNSQFALNGWSALMYAVNSACSQYSSLGMKSAAVEIIKILLEHGADINSKSWSGRSAVDVCIQRDCIDMARTLLSSQGVQQVVIQEPEVQRHPIFDAIANDDSVRVAQLIRQKQSAVFERDAADSFTPLMLASLKGDSASARLLLENGAEVNAKDDVSWTALMYASYYNHLDLVKLLILNGGLVLLQEEKAENEEAIDKELKAISTNQEIVKLLKSHVKVDDNELNQTGNQVSWYRRMMFKKPQKDSDSVHSRHSGKQTDIFQISPMDVSPRRSRQNGLGDIDVLGELEQPEGYRSNSRQHSRRFADTASSGSNTPKVEFEGYFDNMSTSSIKRNKTSQIMEELKQYETMSLVKCKSILDILKHLQLEQYQELLQSYSQIQDVNDKVLDDAGVKDNIHRKLIVQTCLNWKTEIQKLKIKSLHKQIDGMEIKTKSSMLSLTEGLSDKVTTTDEVVEDKMSLIQQKKLQARKAKQ